MRIFTYRIPLTAPLALAAGTLHERTGLLLLAEAAGERRWAEAAPLPGFSVETVADCLAAAHSGDWQRWPSLRFARYALEQPATHPPTPALPLSRLLAGSLETVRRELEQTDWTMVPAIKIKVGRHGAVREEISLVRAAAECLRSGQRLRLDANRQWTRAEAAEFAREVTELPVDYLEEPTLDPSDGEWLWKKFRMPYALDETLQQATIPWNAFPHVSALILKPTVLGWPPRWWDTRPRDVPLVFSACFESGVGLCQIARLAARYAPTTPNGLDTARWLTADLLSVPLAWAAGQFPICPEIQVDARLLTEVNDVSGFA